jgi:hypothetical protein
MIKCDHYYMREGITVVKHSKHSTKIRKKSTF